MNASSILFENLAEIAVFNDDNVRVTWAGSAEADGNYGGLVETGVGSVMKEDSYT